MRRREFLGVLGIASAWPLTGHAQQSAMPTLGFLSSRTPKQADNLVIALRDGLSSVGIVEGQNIAIEYRYAEGQYDRLPALAAELVGRKVAVILAGGTSGPAIAAAKSIPVVFTTGFDPVSAGLVNSLNRPDSNVTGATFYSGALGAKQIEILTELAPKTATFGLLINPNSPSAATQIRDTQSATRSIGRELQVLRAGTESEVDAAFAALAQFPIPALIVSVDPFFDSRPTQLTGLASRY